MSLLSCPEPAALEKLQHALFRSEHRGKPNPVKEFLTLNTKKHTPPHPRGAQKVNRVWPMSCPSKQIWLLNKM